MELQGSVTLSMSKYPHQWLGNKHQNLPLFANLGNTEKIAKNVRSVGTCSAIIFL